MSRKIIQLALLLETQGFTKEADDVFDLIDPYVNLDAELTEWKTAYEKISAPAPKQIHGRLWDSLRESVGSLEDKRSEIDDLDPETLKKGVELTKGVIAQYGYSDEVLLKYSKVGIDEKITKQAIDVTGASWGASALRSIPVVGFIFSFLFVIKNMYYFGTTLPDLLSEAGHFGISPWNSLDAENLEKLRQDHDDDSAKIPLVDKLTKTVRLIKDEFISLLANTIDLIKDIIFAFLSISGIAIWFDVGLSVMIMAAEWAIESKALAPFNEIINKIRFSVRGKYIDRLKSAYDRDFDPDEDVLLPI